MTASTGTDERELFESAYSRSFPLPSGANNFMRDGEGYAYLRVQGRWEGFKLGRASLGAAQVPAGWVLVPETITREMWKAVNKLDDEMAAGSYDGKGCSIEQAWDCLLANAPEAPAGAAQAPAFEAARDAILNERGPLEGMGLTGDQINAVLAILDDSFQTTQGGK